MVKNHLMHFEVSKEVGLAEAVASLNYQAHRNVPFSTFVALVKDCGDQKAVWEGRLVHGQSIRHGRAQDIYLGNLFVDMYGRCGLLPDARATFDRIQRKNSFSWNIMIAIYIQYGHDKEALGLFKEMHDGSVSADKHTFSSVLTACASMEALFAGRCIHASIVEAGAELDSYINSALVSMYGKCGNLNDAHSLFNKLSNFDLVSWNAMITAYVQEGHDVEALHLYQQMQRQGVKPALVTLLSILGACQGLAALAEGKIVHAAILEGGSESSILLATALISMYSACGSLEDAQAVFETMHQRDTVSLSAMITAYVEHEKHEEALGFFWQMHAEGITYDTVTFVCVLSACASIAALAHGQLVHSHAIELGLPSSVVIGNALLNMYGKCGNIADANVMFNSICLPNVISWASMIEAHACAADAAAAWELFTKMQEEGLTPNDITFVNLLSACSHAGLLYEGRECFESTTLTYGMEATLQHFVIMVDLLGRAGCLDIAETVVQKMPICPSVVLWETLLSACRFHGDVERGKFAAEQAVISGSQDAAAHVQLSHIYDMRKLQRHGQN